MRRDLRRRSSASKATLVKAGIDAGVDGTGSLF
jgi:hypothetical protein